MSFMRKHMCARARARTHTHTHTHTPFLHSKRALEGLAFRLWENRKRKEAATEDVRLYLTYSSFEICWCATSQPSQDSSRLDEKHFYWALWGGQLLVCVCVRVRACVCVCLCMCVYLCVIVCWQESQPALLAMSDETLLLSRVNQ